MAQAQRELQPGEQVSWSYGVGQAKGQVVEKITENKKIGSRVFKASPDDPKYLVKSDTSGKEAVKKPETLNKIEADKGHDGKPEAAGTKEKRTQLKARSSREERKEAEREESSKKVQDTGKGSVRASAKAAQNKIKDVSGRDDTLLEDTGEQEDETYEPKKDELEAQDEEEAIADLPTDEEALAEAEKEVAEEGRQAVDAANLGDDEEEEGDHTYDPAKDKDVGADTAEDEEVIDTLPPDEELIKQTEKENKEAVVEGVAASEGQQSTEKV
ncbi:hypothetical protein GOP47_0009102 [Adiantum capillus-veneris]|uniref:Hypervirulence associated protein TUDOR domain-containing protein n=1 Tax=Adiantum capillus-veneris TaxID=13818 RepID=A0A9D4V120_ADICA|nr:hypothetical protein GOP47_0009102 [Adiantum capillus-veneris]